MAKSMEAFSSFYSSASSSASYNNYDVFLNFRGEDTRNNFTSFLHKAPKREGINVFMDSENLWSGAAIGPALTRAIEGSKISIPVFSQGYASSKWCLKELSEIHNCHKSNGHIVLPIFFDVEPSHVRNQTGSFQGSFQEHEQNFESPVVESWREALTAVGSLKGWVLSKDTNGNQAALVDLVVKRALDELISSIHFVECKYPIGLDSHVNKMLSLLNCDSDDVRIVGVCGLGGIGKTTIAKAVYNRIFLNFKGHSFLRDIREATQFMTLQALQNRLLKDVLKISIDIDDYHRGKNVIKQRLCTKKVLIVLDDVDTYEQLDALVGEINWFGQGTRVIITTRDEHILHMAKVDAIYWPQELNLKDSLQVFSLHAFSMSQPPNDYMQLSHAVVRHIGGLPLILEVIGSSLSDISNKEVWEKTLQKLKEIPYEHIQTMLKISYDNLEDEHEKSIFLDVACFFSGWDKETAMSIWEACGLYPTAAIQRLTKRSLLKFEYNEYGVCCLRMHGQIRDMGRTIVIIENLMEPSKRSRLWSYDEILQVLEGHKGTDKIKGMIVPPLAYEVLL
ncbi:disease resistance protein RUN1-like [Telopea speciosissima]|uniref:disease resistance protein RUN1-like n=1 Tax=Telopea speciosissima TaxID=54955 RepID=UPI001CC6970F|nr:disease resistance protein RUN1-like [Telopea speciosissima]